NADGTVATLLKQQNYATSSSPNFGLTAMFNHKFRNRNNLNISVTASSVTSNSYSNPLSNYLVGQPLSAEDQLITTYSRTNSIGTTISYLTPLSHNAFLEFNYAFNYS